MRYRVICLLIVGLLIGAFVSCGDGKRSLNHRTGNKNPMKTTELPEIPFVQKLESTSSSSTKCLNVYLENSGSMNGYVKGNTGFEQSIYYYLTQIENNEVVDSLNLYYINSKVILQGDDIENFIHHVEPADFQKKGGNLGSSDIAVILDSVLNRHKSDAISLFISDCIFSPEQKMSESEVPNYLTEQSTRIERVFREKLKELNNKFAVVICQLQSDFDGRFFNRENKVQWITHKRPFYFWLFGSPVQIHRLLEVVPFDCLKGKGAEVENLYTICRTESSIDYGIVNIGKVGSFERNKQNPKYDILNCKPNNKGQQHGLFQFAIGVNYAALPLDGAFLLNPDNYELNTKDYKITIKPNTVKTLNCTHLFYLSTLRDPVPAQRVEIALKNHIPFWVGEKNDPIGLDLERDDAFDKTFGLKPLVEGVCNAFGGEGFEYVKFVVQVNKK